MIEIRFHGRGGQGAVVGSETLAHAFFIEGRYVQAFPAFGVERRGAPVVSFCRVDERSINLRTQIYSPDHIVVLDSSLLDTIDVTQGLKRGGVILINGKKSPSQYRERIKGDFEIWSVDASSIALRYGLGSSSNPIVNTAILGAFSKATGIVRIESVEEAIIEYVPVKKEENRKAAREAYERVIKE